MGDMVDRAHKLPIAISGGQQQRVAITRALANNPPTVVADEPIDNHDSETADSVIQLCKELIANSKTILMVTHDSELASRTTRIVTLADGEIAHQTTNDGLPEFAEVRQGPIRPGRKSTTDGDSRNEGKRSLALRLSALVFSEVTQC